MKAGGAGTPRWNGRGSGATGEHRMLVSSYRVTPRIGRLTRWLPLLAVWIASATYVGARLDRGWFPLDEGALGHSAERVLAGELPHRDFDDAYTGGLARFDAVVFEVLGTRLLIAPPRDVRGVPALGAGCVLRGHSICQPAAGVRRHAAMRRVEYPDVSRRDAILVQSIFRHLRRRGPDTIHGDAPHAMGVRGRHRRRIVDRHQDRGDLLRGRGVPLLRVSRASAGRFTAGALASLARCRAPGPILCGGARGRVTRIRHRTGLVGPRGARPIQGRAVRPARRAVGDDAVRRRVA